MANHLHLMRALPHAIRVTGARHLRLTLFLSLSSVVLLATGCGGSEANTPTAAAPDAARAERARLPDHNPSARFDGKTALEYAEGLDDLNTDVQMKALFSIGQFGVDGLPAREKVRALIGNTRVHEDVQLLAIAVLTTMQAPEATDLVREKLSDPDFASSDDIYVTLIAGLKEAEVEPAVLLSDMRRVARSDLDHATRLMLLNELPKEAQEGLERAVFEADFNEKALDYFLAKLPDLEFVDDEARGALLDRLVTSDMARASGLMMRRTLPEKLQQRLTLAILQARGGEESIHTHSDQLLNYFFINLPAMDFVDGDTKIAFVRDNSPFASRPNIISRAHQILLSVGTEQAMEVALRYGGHAAQRAYPLMINFARAEVAPVAVLERMRADFDESTRADSINQIAGYMELLALEMDKTSKPEKSVRQPFVDTMTAMLRDGPSESHRAVGALYLTSYVRKSRDVDLPSTLEPVFAVLGDNEAPGVVRGTAGNALKELAAESPNRPGLLPLTAQALWQGEDVNATHFPEQILIAAATGRNAQPESVIRAVAPGVDDHLDQWAVNPAAVVLMNAAANGRLNRTKAKEEASIALGKLFASRQANPHYLNDHFRKHMHRIISGNRAFSNTLDGLIGILEPFYFAQHRTIIHQNNPDQWARRISNPDTHALAMDSSPEELQRWRQFLERIAATGDSSRYDFVARQALASLDQYAARSR